MFEICELTVTVVVPGMIVPGLIVPGLIVPGLIVPGVVRFWRGGHLHREENHADKQHQQNQQVTESRDDPVNYRPDNCNSKHDGENFCQLLHRLRMIDGSCPQPSQSTDVGSSRPRLEPQRKFFELLRFSRRAAFVWSICVHIACRFAM
jgi:hypothetical protein